TFPNQQRFRPSFANRPKHSPAPLSAPAEFATRCSTRRFPEILSPDLATSCLRRKSPSSTIFSRTLRCRKHSTEVLAPGLLSNLFPTNPTALGSQQRRNLRPNRSRECRKRTLPPQLVDQPRPPGEISNSCQLPNCRCHIATSRNRRHRADPP